MNASQNADIVPGEAAGLAEYRSPHILALLTLLVGLLTFLALFHTVFWSLPLVTLVLGVFSLWSLARNPEKIGRKAVLFSMALALLFGTWAPARYLARQHWLAGMARTYADAWVELVQQKKLRDAHQQHVITSQRALGGEQLEEFYQKLPPAQTDYVRFFDSEPLKTLSHLTPDARIEFDRYDGYTPEMHSDTVILRYVAKYEQAGQPRELPFRVFMERKLDPRTGDYHWRAERVTAG
ncbi:MAG: hypothetical protein ACYC3X_13640 [Pirellulaceae bacterium]